MAGEYGALTYGDGEYSEVDNGYGYALYGTGVFGTVTIRIDGAAAITSVSTVAAAAGYVKRGAADVTSVSTVAASAGYARLGSAAITSVSTVACDNSAGGIVRTASADITSVTTVTASAEPKLEGKADITSISTVVCVAVYEPLIAPISITTITTVSADAELKWIDIPAVTGPVWTDITSPWT